jgi:hypothetical protein
VEKLDKKFYGEIRKAKDDSIVPDDEYVVFLVKDNAFAATLPTYRQYCELMGADVVQLEMVDQLIERVYKWRAGSDRCKVPDAAGEKVLA